MEPESLAITGNLEDAFVGRQPIFDADFNTYAYELLFRAGECNSAQFEDAERATAELMLNVFSEIGLEAVVGKTLGFVNVTEDFLLSGHCNCLPKDRVVIEILEDVPPTQEVITAVKALRASGYQIALDDFTLTDEMIPLVKFANIIKVDLQQYSAQQLEHLVTQLNQHNVKLLAEKVETTEELKRCKELGFDYYQGYLFCKPTIVQGKKVAINRVSAMSLISKLQTPGVTADEIAAAIETEPGFAVRLLRYVNSAFHGLTYEIESIRHAVNLVGVRQIQSICSLTALVAATEDRPTEFVRMMLIRAKMAEQLAIAANLENSDRYFLAGLFSGLDLILNISIEKAVNLVPLLDEIRQAILERNGQIGELLDCVLDYESGNWDELKANCVKPNEVLTAYLEAIRWADQSLKF